MTRLSLLRLEPRDTPTDLVALGPAGVDQPARLVRVLGDGSLATQLSVLPFPGFPGEVRVAAGDVTGDRVADLVTAAGPGGGPHVRVFDGVTGDEVHSFFAYDPGFPGGVDVDVADFTRDGVADIVTGAGAGGGPHVVVFDGRTLNPLWSLFAYDQRFRGGVSVAAGDLTLDGVADIATGAGPGAGPHVVVFDGRTLAPLQSYFAFEPSNPRGVNVALGDVTNDGRADLVASLASPPPRPTSSLVGIGLTTPAPAIVAITQNPALPSQFVRAYDPFPGFTGGIRVGTADVDGDGRQDALFATGPGDSRLRVVFARDILAGNGLNTSLLTGPLYAGGGLFVG